MERRESKMDAAATQRVIEHHVTPEEAGRVFSAAKPRLAVYSHIVPSPTTAKELEFPTRKTYSGPLVVGEDLMTITVGESIEMGKAGRGRGRERREAKLRARKMQIRGW